VAYEAMRADIQSGDLLLCAGSSIFAQLIQHATHSMWSHVGVLVRLDALDRVMVLESVESRGVQCGPLSQYVRDYNGTGTGYAGRVFVARHARFPRDDAARLKAFCQGAVDLLNYPYNSHEIVAIAARLVAGRLGWSPDAIPTNGRTFICSEYVDARLQTLGIQVPFDVQAGVIIPNDFAVDPEIVLLWEVAVEHG